VTFSGTFYGVSCLPEKITIGVFVRKGQGFRPTPLWLGSACDCRDVVLCLRLQGSLIRLWVVLLQELGVHNHFGLLLDSGNLNAVVDKGLVCFAYNRKDSLTEFLNPSLRRVVGGTNFGKLVDESHDCLRDLDTLLGVGRDDLGHFFPPSWVTSCSP